MERLFPRFKLFLAFAISIMMDKIALEEAACLVNRVYLP
jgi:hypothetical protein